MADRPRRSTRSSAYASPAQTPGSGNATSTPARFAQHSFTASTPFYRPSASGSISTPTGGSLIQAGSALLSQNFPGFQSNLLPHGGHNLHYPSPHNLPPSWTVGKSSAPIPPFTPLIPPTMAPSSSSSPTAVQPIPQAIYSTYASRMKVGSTTLVQPIQQPDLFDPLGRPIDAFGTPLNDSRTDYGTPTGSVNPYRSARASTKRRAAAGYIRYTEADESADDFEEDVPRFGTEDELITRRVRRRVRSPSRGGGGGTGIHMSDPTMLARDDDDGQDENQAGKNFLGLPPPGNKIVAKRIFKQTPHIYHGEEDLMRQASRNEVLVPIKIELETDTFRIKDTFTWNMNEKLITPYHFAKTLLEDLDMPIEPFATQIQNMIIQQVEEAVGVADIEVEPASGGIWSRARLDSKEGEIGAPEDEPSDYDQQEENVKESRQWDWGIHRKDNEQAEWRKKIAKRLETGKGLGEIEDDLRVIVDYEVQILRHMLRDRMEWDLCSPLTPESFAAQLSKDLGLSGEAQTLISNSIREQLLHHKRAALELGLLGTGKVLREKEKEVEKCRKEVEIEKQEKARKKLEAATGGLETTTCTTREASEMPDLVGVELDGNDQDGNATDIVTAVAASASVHEEKQREDQEPTTSLAVSTEPNLDQDTGNSNSSNNNNNNNDEEEEEDVETLHLTATATANPTREGTCTPLLQPVITSSSSSLTLQQSTLQQQPFTRSSSRLQLSSNTIATTTSSNPNVSVAPFSDPFSLLPNSLQPKQSLLQRLHSATFTIREILSKSSRPLEAVWRDFHESREFGPLLERLTDDDLEKLEEANVRASRRNRREGQRGMISSTRRRR